jgi:GTP-binding protein HflX
MKFSSKPVAETSDAPLADSGHFEAIVERFQRRDPPAKAPSHERNACYVVCALAHDDPCDEDNRLNEILGLVRAHGDRVVGHEVVRPKRPDPKTYLGKGAAEQLADRAFATGADMIVLDAELSPSQTRNLEEATGLPIADREAVILEVFEAHATTRRARIQVEVAHLEYLRPRIRGLGLEMDQQASGAMNAGGAAKARGPGETASELLARRLDGRLADLRRALAKLTRAGATQRARRSSCARIALVGYTNAGKTSLMNALTGANLSAKDQPFETLDATARALTRHGGDVVISDTVGFIRRLPQRLLASFESTLAELAEATLLALVIDISDSEWRMHLEETERMLDRLGASAIPRLYVFNKIDRHRAPLDDALLSRTAERHEWVALSSYDVEAVAALRDRLIAAARPNREVRRLFVSYEDAERMATVHRRCLVLASEAKPHGIRFTLEADPRVLDELQEPRRHGRDERASHEA